MTYSFLMRMAPPDDLLDVREEAEDIHRRLKSVPHRVAASQKSFPAQVTGLHSRPEKFFTQSSLVQ